MWTNRPPIQKAGSGATPPIRAHEHAATPTLPPLPFPLVASSRCSSAGSSVGTSSPPIYPSHSPVTLPGSECSDSHAQLAELVQQLSWEHTNDLEPAPPSSRLLHHHLRSAGEDVTMEDLPAPALTTQPPSPVLAAMASGLLFANDSLHARPHPHRDAPVRERAASAGHRKVASCPFQLSELNAAGLAPSPSPGGSPRPERERAPRSPGKLLHAHNHTSLFHPYSRAAERERDITAIHTPVQTPAVSTHQPQPHASPSSSAAAAQHRPTVISPASRFLSRKLASNLPAALVHQALSLAANGGPSSCSASPPPSHSPTFFPPPLSLTIVAPPPTAADTAHPHHYGQYLHSPSHSANGGGSGADSCVVSPPPSPSMGGPSPIPRPGASSVITVPGHVRTATGSPMQRPLHPHARTHTFAYPPSSPIAGERDFYTHGGFASSATSSASPASLMGIPHHRCSSGATSGSSSPSPTPHSPLIRPDFSAFDSAGNSAVLGGWHRLSSHSPAKHRSLPGTPLQKPHHVYSVPPTPNARLAKQARSRRNSSERSLMETPAILFDYTALQMPVAHLPLMTPLPSNPSWHEMVEQQEDLGQGSFGHVFRVQCSRAQPFPSHAHNTAVATPSSHATHTSAPASPFMMPFAPATHHAHAAVAATPVAMHDETIPAWPTVSPSTATAATSSHLFAWKRTLKPFVSLQERQRMLKKYTHVYELIQKLKTHHYIAAAATAPTPDSDATALAAFICPVTFFPLNLVHHSHVWQEHNKLNVLMELCSRGDLMTYWSQLTDEEVNRIKAEQPDANDADSLYDHSPDDDADDNASLPSCESIDPPRPPLSPLCESTVWRLLFELCSSLALMHHHGFYHLDVKPANIFVTESEQFKLGDMDSCLMLHEARSTFVPGVIAADLIGLEEGDGMWCAPELIRSAQDVSDKCDVYSLGCSVYAVLNDEIVTRDEMSAAVLHFRHLKCPISRTLHDTLVQMTDGDPTQRPTALEVMQRAQRMLASPTPENELKLLWPRT